MDVLARLKQLVQRDRFVHKGQCGRVGVFAGSQTMAGAAVLVGKAAFRSGSGLVYTYCQEEFMRLALLAQCPELIGIYLDHDLLQTNQWEQDVKHRGIEVLAVGPGLGRTIGSVGLLHRLINYACLAKLRVVLDADGLNGLTVDQLQHCQVNSMVLTPHEGEFKQFFPTLSSQLSHDVSERKEIAFRAAQASGQVVVLKGHQTIVASQTDVYVNSTGNPSMAVAGMGDVLTGIIASFLGQGLTSYEAACAGVYCHGLVADRLQKQYSIGLIATDIIDYIPIILSELS